MSTITLPALTDANRAWAKDAWAQISYAQGQHNARGRHSASRKARRLLSELLGHEVHEHASLTPYFDALDRALWGDVYEEN